MNILIIEDDIRIARPLELHLRHEHHCVEIAHDGAVGLSKALGKKFDFILLDLMLPQLDGLTVCHKLRNAGCNSAIIMLTARGKVSDKITGLELGADDYIEKPFELAELSARMKAVSRRGRELLQPTLSFRELHVDQNSCNAYFQNKPLNLTPTEYRLIVHFLSNPSRIFRKEDLLDALWHHSASVNDDIVKTHMKGLRSKLVNAGAPRDLIETVYGLGYRLKTHA